MNKIFTLSAALLLGSLVSQANITATVDGKPIEHGTTLEINADDFINEPVAGMNVYTAELNIKVVSNAAPVNIDLSCDDQNTIQFCPSAAGCIPLNPDGDHFSGSAVVKDAEFDVPVHVRFRFVPELPDFKGKMEVILTDKNMDVLGFYIDVNTTRAGIGNVDAAPVASFRNNVLSYNLQTPATLAVYSITGASVINRTVSGNGTVDFSTLPRGIYIYTLGGKATKVLVR